MTGSEAKSHLPAVALHDWQGVEDPALPLLRPNCLGPQRRCAEMPSFMGSFLMCFITPQLLTNKKDARLIT
jgi:hypothetical protein